MHAPCPIHPSIHQSTNQPTNQPIERSIHPIAIVWCPGPRPARCGNAPGAPGLNPFGLSCHPACHPLFYPLRPIHILGGYLHPEQSASIAACCVFRPILCAVPSQLSHTNVSRAPVQAAKHAEVNHLTNHSHALAEKLRLNRLELSEQQQRVRSQLLRRLITGHRCVPDKTHLWLGSMRRNGRCCKHFCHSIAIHVRPASADM